MQKTQGKHSFPFYVGLDERRPMINPITSATRAETISRRYLQRGGVSKAVIYRDTIHGIVPYAEVLPGKPLAIVSEFRPAPAFPPQVQTSRRPAWSY